MNSPLTTMKEKCKSAIKTQRGRSIVRRALYILRDRARSLKAHALTAIEREHATLNAFSLCLSPPSLFFSIDNAQFHRVLGYR